MSNQIAPAISNNRRLDIQGLRAFAVIIVIAFHADLPIPGGFVGVDVFFVISGFVITAMLLREKEKYGGVRFGNFWKRRFLRLTPALAVLVAVVILASLVFLFPDGQRLTVQTGLGAIFLVANLVIARNTGGYFDGPAELNPLLNTWSLSVEEQFYLIFPFILAAAWWIQRKVRWARQIPLLAVMLIALVSFGLAIFAVSPGGSGSGITFLNFYSPFIRAWEFAFGSILALLVIRGWRLSRPLNEILALLGLGGLVLSCFLITASTPFPGPWTLLPVVSTAVLIYTGTSNTSFVSRGFGLRPAALIGDWSYSLYLWHWPVISFAIAIGFRSTGALLVAVLISLPLALASYYGVEQPIRNMRSLSKPVLAGLVSGVVLIPVAVASFALFVYQTPSLHRGNTGVGYLEYIAENSYPCEIPQTPGNLSRCRQSQADGPISVALIGDSHAEHLFPGIMTAFPDTNILYTYLPGWPYETSENSALTISSIAEDPSIGVVVISSRWDEGQVRSAELASTVQLMASSGKATYLVNDGPYFSFNAQECKYQRPLGQKQQCDESSAEFQANFDSYNGAFQALAAVTPGTSLLDISENFCQDGVCSMLIGDQIMYSDQGHLNVDGSNYVFTKLKETDPEFFDRVRSVGGASDR